MERTVATPRMVIKSRIFSTDQDLCDFINDNCIPVENIVDIDMSCYTVGSAVKQKILMLYEEVVDV